MKVNKNYYVLSSENGEINTRDTENEMIREFDSKYKFSFAPLTSVIINNLQFQPSIIGMSINEMNKNLFNLKKGVKTNKIRSPAGGFYGVGCNRNKKNIEKIFDNGKKVELS